MKFGKIISVLLAVLLLAGCVGCVSGVDISSITITGIDTPTTGAKPDTSASTSTPGVKVELVSWYLSGDTFDADTKYTVTIQVSNNSGYTFADSVSATVNGKTATASKLGSRMSVSYEFDKTAGASPTSDIKISLTKPLAANTPATTATVTDPENRLTVKSVTWSPSDSKFKLGTKYTATVVLKSVNEKAYPISTSVTAKVNGNSATVKDKSTSEVTITYEFPATEPKGTAESFAFTVRSPVVGEKPATAVASNSQSDKTTATLTWDTTSAFKPDTSYTATITIYAKEGYLIKENAPVTINGIQVIPVWESNTKGSASYTFSQIASVNTVDLKFPAPASGETAVTKAVSVTTQPGGSASDADITWTPALMNGEFESGVEYTASVTVPIISSSNTVFDEETAVFINGYKATVVSVTSDKLTATYAFPKTTFIPNPIDIIKEFFQLMLALFNPASYVFF